MTAQRTQEPALAASAGVYQVWTLGRAAAVMPRLHDDWPEPLKAAWRRRLMANLTMRCECGGTGGGSRVSGWASIEHVGDCPASDDRFLALLDGVA